MKKIFFCIIFLTTLFIISTSSAFAATYYISPTGSDTNPGSVSQPWKTVQKGVSSVSAGDILYVREGTYNEAVNITKSGTSENPITLSSYPEENAIINGGSGIALKSPGGSQYWVIEKMSFQSTNRYTLQIGWWYSAEITNWIIRNNKIYGSSVIKGSNNLIESNDVSGVYPDGSKYGSYTGQGSGDAGIMDINESHHNTFRSNNIHDFSNTDGRGIWTQGWTHDDLIENNTVTNIVPGSGIGQSIDLDGAGSVSWNHVVRGNKINGNNYVGIQLENVFNSVIENNTIQNTGSNGIIVINYNSNVGCPAVGTKGNPYGDTNSNGTCKDEITDNIIRQNLITTNSGWGWGYGGITNFGARGVSILGNTIYSTYGSGNGGINYQNQASYSDHAIVKNNIIASANGIGICSVEGFAIFTEDDHNLLYNGKNTMVYGTGTNCSGSNTLSTYQSSTGKGVGSVQSDPLFKNVSGNDFHILSNSPAIDHGSDIGISADLDGFARPQGSGFDIGVYEFESSTQPVPTQTTPTPAPSPTPKKGDANSDNKVDETDYEIWFLHYNQTLTGSIFGDFNSSGKVDGVDYVIWLNNYGK